MLSRLHGNRFYVDDCEVVRGVGGGTLAVAGTRAGGVEGVAAGSGEGSELEMEEKWVPGLFKYNTMYMARLDVKTALDVARFGVVNILQWTGAWT